MTLNIADMNVFTNKHVHTCIFVRNSCDLFNASFPHSEIKYLIHQFLQKSRFELSDFGGPERTERIIAIVKWTVLLRTFYVKVNGPNEQMSIIIGGTERSKARGPKGENWTVNPTKISFVRLSAWPSGFT